MMPQWRRYELSAQSIHSHLQNRNWAIPLYFIFMLLTIQTLIQHIKILSNTIIWVHLSSITFTSRNLKETRLSHDYMYYTYVVKIWLQWSIILLLHKNPGNLVRNRYVDRIPRSASTLESYFLPLSQSIVDRNNSLSVKFSAKINNSLLHISSLDCSTKRSTTIQKAFLLL